MSKSEWAVLLQRVSKTLLYIFSHFRTTQSGTCEDFSTNYCHFHCGMVGCHIHQVVIYVSALFLIFFHTP